MLPSLPDREGLGGAFAGVADGSLIVAGGSKWVNGVKVWSDSVFALDRPDGQWKIVGKLPRPISTGASVTAGQGVVCVGGGDETRHYSDAFLLKLTHGRLETKSLPSLPLPLANTAGGLVGDTVIIFGGSTEPVEKAALNRLFALDLVKPSAQWLELPPCPGKPRILPIAAVMDGAFYIAGGSALETIDGKISREYLRDAWRYQSASGWQRLADMPRPCLAAASPAPSSGQEFYLIGGDDGSLAGLQPQQPHPGFLKQILVYNAGRDTWRIEGETPAPRAVLPTAFWQGHFVLPCGEVRPRVRSPEVWNCSPAVHK